MDQQANEYNASGRARGADHAFPASANDFERKTEKGKGKWKRWTAPAVLRAGFSSESATSRQIASSIEGGGPKHAGRCRFVTASAILEGQNHGMALVQQTGSQGSLDFWIRSLMFDESTFSLSLQHEAATATSVLCSHGHWTYGFTPCYYNCLFFSHQTSRSTGMQRRSRTLCPWQKRRTCSPLAHLEVALGIFLVNSWPCTASCMQTCAFWWKNMILLAIGLRPTLWSSCGNLQVWQRLCPRCLPSGPWNSPMDILFLRLGPNVGLIEEPPFSLRVQYYADRLDAAPLHDNDLAICAQLALEAGDWVIHRLELAGIDDDPSKFRIARKISYDAEHLQEEARQQKENDLAMRAFRLMERLKSGQKRQRRPRGPQPSTKKARQTAMPCDEQGELSPSRLSEESWSQDSEWAGSAGEEDQDPMDAPWFESGRRETWHLRLRLCRWRFGRWSRLAKFRAWFQGKLHGVVCRHCCWHGLWPGCPVREVKESGTKARGSLGTLLAVAHCAARRTNRVGSHLRLAPQQRRWKWLEVQESFEHGPVEPQRLHITIETVASSRAQWCRAFCPERSVRSCGHDWPWEDLAYKLWPKAPQKKRWTRKFDNILPQVFVLWSDFPLYSFWRCLSFACGCDPGFRNIFAIDLW